MSAVTTSSGVLLLGGHEKDLGGGFVVRRLLPSAHRQSVGPFLFLDHFGPVQVQPTDNHDVRPHPHIGLATITYLFEGAIDHRDNLGSHQVIEPGAVNWMTAGRGIVHSERAPAHLKGRAYTNHGLQLWAALPVAAEEAEAAFEHTPAASIPQARVGGVQVRVLIGEAFGLRSPVRTYSRTLYLDVALAPGQSFALPALEAELSVYPVDADVVLTLAGQAQQTVATHQLAVLPTAGTCTLQAKDGPVRLVVLGGEPLDGHRHMWWNFVSSRKDRIAQAAQDWRAMAVGSPMAQVPGESEFIPLPDKPF